MDWNDWDNPWSIYSGVNWKPKRRNNGVKVRFIDVIPVQVLAVHTNPQYRSSWVQNHDYDYDDYANWTIPGHPFSSNPHIGQNWIASLFNGLYGYILFSFIVLSGQKCTVWGQCPRKQSGSAGCEDVCNGSGRALVSSLERKVSNLFMEIRMANLPWKPDLASKKESLQLWRWGWILSSGLRKMFCTRYYKIH